MKMKLLSAVILLTLLVSVFIKYLIGVSDRKYFSERPIQYVPLSPLESTNQFAPISRINSSDLHEISKTSQGENNSVLAFSEAKEPDTLQVLFASGAFIRWDMKNSQVISRRILFSARGDVDYVKIYEINSNISFNNNGSYLLTPSEINYSNYVHGSERDYVIWDLDSLTELGLYSGSDYSFALHPSSDIFISASSDLSMTFGFLSKDGGGAPLIYRGEEKPYFMRIATDPLGDYLAVSDRTGYILLGDISRLKSYRSDNFFNLFSPSAAYHTMYPLKKDETSVDLEFDDTHSWLGWATNEKLVVWSLNNYAFPLQLKRSIKGVNAICFDRSGQVLAVASQEGIKIFDLTDKKQSADYRVGEVTALYFTRDNRLLIWGNSKGEVHFWGVK